MSDLLLGLGAGFIVLAGLVHIMIFSLESLRWSQPPVWKKFGIESQADADVTAPLAYNQGYYNLFLAVGTIGGVVAMYAASSRTAGASIALFAAGSMVAAATVLITSNMALAKAAVMQGALPLTGCVLLAIGLASA